MYNKDLSAYMNAKVSIETVFLLAARHVFLWESSKMFKQVTDVIINAFILTNVLFY